MTRVVTDSFLSGQIARRSQNLVFVDQRRDGCCSSYVAVLDHLQTHSPDCSQPAERHVWLTLDPAESDGGIVAAHGFLSEALRRGLIGLGWVNRIGVLRILRVQLSQTCLLSMLVFWESEIIWGTNVLNPLLPLPVDISELVPGYVDPTLFLPLELQTHQVKEGDLSL